MPILSMYQAANDASISKLRSNVKPPPGKGNMKDIRKGAHADDDELDLMDPSSYSDAPHGGWVVGLKGVQPRAVDTTATDCPDCEELSCLYFYQEFHILSFILGIQKRIFKKRSKKKAKNKQIQAREGKGQVKSKSKVIHLKKIQLEGLKLPSLKLYYKRLKRQGSKLPTE
ncbi:hypothetical protein Tco_1538960 [Tanacetum coccineum]